MNIHMILGLIAIGGFVVLLFGRGEGLPIGLIFLTLMLMF